MTLASFGPKAGRPAVATLTGALLSGAEPAPEGAVSAWPPDWTPYSTGRGSLVARPIRTPAAIPTQQPGDRPQVGASQADGDAVLGTRLVGQGGTVPLQLALQLPGSPLELPLSHVSPAEEFVMPSPQ